MDGDPDLENYILAVKDSLRTILGDSGAKAILFYTGEPDPKTFDTKLRSVLGEGAPIILQELNSRLDVDGAAHKHHWFGGRTKAWLPSIDLQRMGGGVTGVRPFPLLAFSLLVE